MTTLTPPDPDRCQAEVPNGAGPFTCGGVPRLIRCSNKPVCIATENQPGEDGQIGSMSLCASCKAEFLKHFPADYASFEEV